MILEELSEVDFFRVVKIYPNHIAFYCIVTVKMFGLVRDLSLSIFVIDTIHSSTLKFMLEDLFK